MNQAHAECDDGCRFPGCSCRRFVDAHHILHWADGGGEIDYNCAQRLLERYHSSDG